jgi:hypothetical protein
MTGGVGILRVREYTHRDAVSAVEWKRRQTTEPAMCDSSSADIGIAATFEGFLGPRSP